jgi:hypothetical protein
MPPPKVRPAMPVVDTAAGRGQPERLRFAIELGPQVRPASARAVRFSRSMRIPFISERSITIPSSHTALPATLWPPPRTAIGRR